MKNKLTNIVIVLLAAGKSSRFGKPKQLLKWKESNLLQYAIDIAKGSIVTHVKLVLGANYDLIVENINADSVAKVTPDENTGSIKLAASPISNARGKA